MGEIPALSLTTFMTLGNSTFGSHSLLIGKMGLETDACKDHRNSGAWNGFQNLAGFANAIFKGVHGERKRGLWSKLWVLIPALAIAPQSS